jgi:hypothetical protein
MHERVAIFANTNTDVIEKEINNWFRDFGDKVEIIERIQSIIPQGVIVISIFYNLK